ncbi:MAG: hypothetical protein WC346_05410 [Methanogenium sp.]|jgi:hypothetical protein
MDDINNYRQNHPELIVKDLAGSATSEVIRSVLKYRGVNKWLRVRRLLIQVKSNWRDRLNQLKVERAAAKEARDWKTYHRLGGYMEALADCRQQVRALCHSPRNVDFPLSPRDFGDVCKLPSNFPLRPHKRWFWIHDGLKEAKKVRHD